MATKFSRLTFPLTRRVVSMKFSGKGPRNLFRESLNDVSNFEYLAAVSLGTPAQNFNVVVDTGSADLWVPTIACGKSCDNPDKFDTAKSSTYQGSTQKFSIQYGEGDGVTGTFAKETVTFGGLTVTNQSFGAVTDGLQFFQNNKDGVDGIIGLGYPGLSTGGYDTFVFSAANQNLISTPILSIYLGAESGTTNGGSVTLGGVDNSHFQGDLQYVDIQPNSSGTYDFWTVNLNGITFNGNSVTSSTTTAILDTGTSLTYLQDDIAKAFYQNVPGATADSTGIYTVDPSFASQNNQVVFTFDNGVAITINQADLAIDQGNGTYIGGICGGGNQVQILGDTFLRSAYISLDGVKNQVGFAQSQ